jgi:hypothetical protein
MSTEQTYVVAAPPPAWLISCNSLTSYGMIKIYFRGHRIVEAIFNALFKRGLKEATEVILTGCSAGGLATYLHAGMAVL